MGVVRGKSTWQLSSQLAGFQHITSGLLMGFFEDQNTSPGQSLSGSLQVVIYKKCYHRCQVKLCRERCQHTR